MDDTFNSNILIKVIVVSIVCMYGDIVECITCNIKLLFKYQYQFRLYKSLKEIANFFYISLSLTYPPRVDNAAIVHFFWTEDIISFVNSY